MIIIGNKNIPDQAFKQLGKYGKILPFETNGITYPAISDHPDVFFCSSGKQLIIASNTPEEFKRALTDNQVSYIEGHSEVGNKYPETSRYNAVITEHFLIHNLQITDNKIKEVCADKTAIHVNQAYTRCNLLPLKNDSFITSDKGIYKTLIANRLNVLYVNPQGIILPEFKHGFFGGTCGVYKNQVFILGSLSKFPDGRKVEAFLTDVDYQIVELYDGSLFDGGSMVFAN